MFNFGQRLFTKAARYEIIDEAGHDSQAERDAAVALLSLGQPDTQLNYSATVRVSSDDQTVTAWLNPYSNDDPLAVKLGPDGAKWRFADDADEDTHAWQDDCAGHSLARPMAKALAKRFPEFAPQ